MHVLWVVHPLDEVAHELRHVAGRRRNVEHVARGRVDDVILDRRDVPGAGDDAAPPASLPTSQSPSPRRLSPSSRKRDISRHGEPRRIRLARNVPTKQARSRRLTIWVFLRPPPTLRSPPGAGPRALWFTSSAGHCLAHHWSVDAREMRATHRLGAGARVEKEPDARHHRHASRAPAARARGHAGC